MKPTLSYLLLKNSFVTELRISANPKYKITQKAILDFEDLQVESHVLRPPKEGYDWQVTLQISYAGKAKCNVPYSFRIEIVGHFDVAKGFPRDEIEKFVRVNGSSVLYSSAREILKGAMSSGPFAQIVLPAVSFMSASAKVNPKGR